MILSYKIKKCLRKEPHMCGPQILQYTLSNLFDSIIGSNFAFTFINFWRVDQKLIYDQNETKEFSQRLPWIDEFLIWIWFESPLPRNNHRSCSVRKGVLRNFAKFTGKYLCQSLSLNKVAGQACNFIKKETLARVFSCECCEISNNTFFTKHL